MKTKLPTEWQELSDRLGFQEFTPIQTQLFEPILAGENLLGVSLLDKFLMYVKRGQRLSA